MKGLSVLRNHLVAEHKRLEKLRSARRIQETVESIELQNKLDDALTQATQLTEALFSFEIGREVVQHDSETH